MCYCKSSPSVTEILSRSWESEAAEPNYTKKSWNLIEVAELSSFWKTNNGTRLQRHPASGFSGGCEMAEEVFLLTYVREGVVLSGCECNQLLKWFTHKNAHRCESGPSVLSMSHEVFSDATNFRHESWQPQPLHVKAPWCPPSCPLINELQVFSSLLFLDSYICLIWQSVWQFTK